METAERRVVAALWSLQGVGPRTIEALRGAVGELGPLLAAPVAGWLRAIRWAPAALAAISRVERLDAVADALEARVRRLGYAIAFPGDPAFPELLSGIPAAPPLLFHLGPGARAPPRRRVAMVGSRRPETGFLSAAARLAREVALAGVGVVSGAAEGVDQACHRGAIVAGGETWAFLGCAIEEVDPPQAQLRPVFEAAGGTFFSEYPPGARPERATFPRRNRLISGASSATLVLRAGAKSGALHTARYAIEQRRRLLAMPGDAHNPLALGCNLLLQTGMAAMCLGAGDVLAAVGVRAEQGGPERGAARSAPSAVPALDGVPQRVLEHLSRVAQTFDELLAATGVSSGELASSLMELELAGHVVQKPGRRYERT